MSKWRPRIRHFFTLRRQPFGGEMSNPRWRNESGSVVYTNDGQCYAMRNDSDYHQERDTRVSAV